MLIMYCLPAIVAGTIAFCLCRWWNHWRWEKNTLGDKHWAYWYGWNKLYFVFDDDNFNYWYKWETRELIPQEKKEHKILWECAIELSWETALHIEGLTACGKQWATWWKDYCKRFGSKWEPYREEREEIYEDLRKPKFGEDLESLWTRQKGKDQSQKFPSRNTPPVSQVTVEYFSDFFPDE